MTEPRTFVKIVADAKYTKHFCEWVDDIIPGSQLALQSNVRTIANVEFIEKDDSKLEPNILSVAAFHRATPCTIEIAVASNGQKRKKASTKFIWTCFDYVFNQLGKLTLIATIAVDNTKSVALAEAMEMRRTGDIAHFFGQDRPALLYTITKEQWKTGRFGSKQQDAINTEPK